MESWDDENFEPIPPVVAPVVVNLNKWEGEDEEEEVKENWEDEDEEEKPKEDDKPSEKPKTKKTSIAEKVAEKERKKREEMEKRLKDAQQEEELSPEEKLRMQQESDLKLALETTFGDGGGGGVNTNAKTDSTILDLNLPNTKEEFQEFTDALSKKLQPLSKNIEYPVFTENLLRNLCATMSSLDIKKIKNTLDNLYMEKQKIEKGDKAKKHKGKGKAKLKIDDENPLSYVNDYDDFDDFM